MEVHKIFKSSEFKDAFTNNLSNSEVFEWLGGLAYHRTDILFQYSDHVASNILKVLSRSVKANLTTNAFVQQSFVTLMDILMTFIPAMANLEDASSERTAVCVYGLPVCCRKVTHKSTSVNILNKLLQFLKHLISQNLLPTSAYCRYFQAYCSLNASRTSFRYCAPPIGCELEKAILNYASPVETEQHRVSAFLRALEFINTCVADTFGPDTKVQVYGSAANGYGTIFSDLDALVVFPDGMEDRLLSEAVQARREEEKNGSAYDSLETRPANPFVSRRAFSRPAFRDSRWGFLGRRDGGTSVWAIRRLALKIFEKSEGGILIECVEDSRVPVLKARMVMKYEEKSEVFSWVRWDELKTIVAKIESESQNNQSSINFTPVSNPDLTSMGGRHQMFSGTLRGNDTIYFVMQLDISVGSRIVLYNTSLLHTYASLDERARGLGLIIKRWAKARNICDPFEGTLSSYGWVLLTIHFLQTCTAEGKKLKPVLPNLQHRSLLPTTTLLSRTGVKGGIMQSIMPHHHLRDTQGGSAGMLFESRHEVRFWHPEAVVTPDVAPPVSKAFEAIDYLFKRTLSGSEEECETDRRDPDEDLFNRDDENSNMDESKNKTNGVINCLNLINQGEKLIYNNNIVNSMNHSLDGDKLKKDIHDTYSQRKCKKSSHSSIHIKNRYNPPPPGSAVPPERWPSVSSAAFDQDRHVELARRVSCLSENHFLSLGELLRGFFVFMWFVLEPHSELPSIHGSPPVMNKVGYFRPLSRSLPSLNFLQRHFIERSRHFKDALEEETAAASVGEVEGLRTFQARLHLAVLDPCEARRTLRVSGPGHESICREILRALSLLSGKPGDTYVNDAAIMDLLLQPVEINSCEGGVVAPMTGVGIPKDVNDSLSRLFHCINFEESNIDEEKIFNCVSPTAHIDHDNVKLCTSTTSEKLDPKQNILNELLIGEEEHEYSQNYQHIIDSLRRKAQQWQEFISVPSLKYSVCSSVFKNKECPKEIQNNLLLPSEEINFFNLTKNTFCLEQNTNPEILKEHDNATLNAVIHKPTSHDQRNLEQGSSDLQNYVNDSNCSFLSQPQQKSSENEQMLKGDNNDLCSKKMLSSNDVFSDQNLCETNHFTKGNACTSEKDLIVEMVRGAEGQMDQQWPDELSPPPPDCISLVDDAHAGLPSYDYRFTSCCKHNDKDKEMIEVNHEVFVEEDGKEVTHVSPTNSSGCFSVSILSSSSSSICNADLHFSNGVFNNELNHNHNFNNYPNQNINNINYELMSVRSGGPSMFHHNPFAGGSVHDVNVVNPFDNTSDSNPNINVNHFNVDDFETHPNNNSNLNNNVSGNLTMNANAMPFRMNIIDDISQNNTMNNTNGAHIPSFDVNGTNINFTLSHNASPFLPHQNSVLNSTDVHTFSPPHTARPNPPSSRLFANAPAFSPVETTEDLNLNDLAKSLGLAPKSSSFVSPIINSIQNNNSFDPTSTGMTLNNNNTNDSFFPSVLSPTFANPAKISLPIRTIFSSNSDTPKIPPPPFDHSPPPLPSHNTLNISPSVSNGPLNNSVMKSGAYDSIHLLTLSSNTAKPLNDDNINTDYSNPKHSLNYNYQSNFNVNNNQTNGIPVLGRNFVSSANDLPPPPFIDTPPRSTLSINNNHQSGSTLLNTIREGPPPSFSPCPPEESIDNKLFIHQRATGTSSSLQEYDNCADSNKSQISHSVNSSNKLLSISQQLHIDSGSSNIVMDSSSLKSITAHALHYTSGNGLSNNDNLDARHGEKNFTGNFNVKSAEPPGFSSEINFRNNINNYYNGNLPLGTENTAISINYTPITHHVTDTNIPNIFFNPDGMTIKKQNNSEKSTETGTKGSFMYQSQQSLNVLPHIHSDFENIQFGLGGSMGKPVGQPAHFGSKSVKPSQNSVNSNVQFHSATASVDVNTATNSQQYLLHSSSNQNNLRPISSQQNLINSKFIPLQHNSSNHTSVLSSQTGFNTALPNTQDQLHVTHPQTVHSARGTSFIDPKFLNINSLSYSGNDTNNHQQQSTIRSPTPMAPSQQVYHHNSQFVQSPNISQEQSMQQHYRQQQTHQHINTQHNMPIHHKIHLHSQQPNSSINLGNRSIPQQVQKQQYMQNTINHSGNASTLAPQQLQFQQITKHSAIQNSNSIDNQFASNGNNFIMSDDNSNNNINGSYMNVSHPQYHLTNNHHLQKHKQLQQQNHQRPIIMAATVSNPSPASISDIAPNSLNAVQQHNGHLAPSMFGGLPNQINYTLGAAMASNNINVASSVSSNHIPTFPHFNQQQTIMAATNQSNQRQAIGFSNNLMYTPFNSLGQNNSNSNPSSLFQNAVTTSIPNLVQINQVPSQNYNTTPSLKFNEQQQKNQNQTSFHQGQNNFNSSSNNTHGTNVSRSVINASNHQISNPQVHQIQQQQSYSSNMFNNLNPSNFPIKSQGSPFFPLTSGFSPLSENNSPLDVEIGVQQQSHANKVESSHLIDLFRNLKKPHIPDASSVPDPHIV